MSEKLRDIMGSVVNARYTYNQSYNSTYDDYDDYDDYDNEYDDIEHDFMTDEM